MRTKFINNLRMQAYYYSNKGLEKVFPHLSQTRYQFNRGQPQYFYNQKKMVIARDGGLTSYLAVTPEARKGFYRSRAKVYCQKKGFLPAIQAPGGLYEYDLFDSVALEAPIKYDKTGKDVGGFRIILRDEGDLPALHASRKYVNILDGVDSKPTCPNLKRDFYATRRGDMDVSELSRVCLTDEFERSAQAFRLLLLSAVKLAVDMYRATKLAGIYNVPADQCPDFKEVLLDIINTPLEEINQYWVAITSKGILRMCERYGLIANSVGIPDIDFHGPRKVALYNLKNCLINMWDHHQDVYKFVMGCLDGTTSADFSPVDIFTNSPALFYLLQEKGFAFDHNGNLVGHNDFRKGVQRIFQSVGTPVIETKYSNGGLALVQHLPQLDRECSPVYEMVDEGSCFIFPETLPREYFRYYEPHTPR